MVRAADGALIVVGERGLMARSADNGDSWQLLPQVYDGSFFGVLALKSKALLAFGMRGHVFRSGDDGKSWQESKVPTGSSLFGGKDRKSTRLNPVTNAHLVCRLLLEKKKKNRL